jgi:hypothetical protein
MFWNKNNATPSTTTAAAAAATTKAGTSIHHQNSLDINLKKSSMPQMTSNMTTRSNSLHYISTSAPTGITNNRNSALVTTTTTNSEATAGHTGANMATSIANSTLRPFYNRLKKSHLFGIKLEKICGNCTPDNNKLPAQIMFLLEKVASEGSVSLMIFRKSASAKLKKSYKDKLDANQAIDYNDMNVHVAALLLKVNFNVFCAY